MDPIQLLHYMPPLRALAPTQLAQIAPHATLLKVRAQAPVRALMAGEPPCLYVSKGRIFLTLSQATILCPMLLQQNQWLNPHTLFPTQVYPTPLIANARTLTPALLVSIPPDILIPWLPITPALTLHLAQYLVLRNQHLTQRLGLTLSLAMEPRTLALLHLLRSMVAPQRATFTLPMNQQQLAQMVGCSRETLSRMLMHLEEEGHLRREGRQVTLLSGFPFA